MAQQTGKAKLVTASQSRSIQKTVASPTSRKCDAPTSNTAPHCCSTARRKRRDDHITATARSAASRSASTNTCPHGSAHNDCPESPILALAPDAEQPSRLSPRTPSDTAGCRVLTRTVHTSREPVFNLEVDDCHEFFANGILVHNCDALRYLCRHLDGRAPVGTDPYGTDFGAGGGSAELPADTFR